MKRRAFFRTGAVASGLAGLQASSLLLSAGCGRSVKPYRQTRTVRRKREDHFTRQFLQRVRSEKYLPKAPAYAESRLNPPLKIIPMPLEERKRRKIVPLKGFCSLAPGGEALISGNGSVNIELAGNPYTELIPFSHESLFMPRRQTAEAPKIAHIFPEVRQMVLDGKYREAAMFAYQEWKKTPITRSGGFGGMRFFMRLKFPGTPFVKDYLRTVDFESTEVQVYWTDERGEWVRRIFTSRPDNVVVQLVTAPRDQLVNARITVSAGGGGRGPAGGPNPTAAGSPAGMQAGNAGPGGPQFDFNEQRLIFKGRLDPSVDNRGYAGITRVVRNGGSASMDSDTLVIKDASSVMLLSRIEYFTDYSEAQVEAVRKSLDELTPNYEALLERARKSQSEMLNRVTVDFGDDSKYGLSSEELLSDQRSSPGYSGAFLRTFFEMCRYWFIITTGKYRALSALTNVNTNLQVAPMTLGYFREGEEAYFRWVESLVPDFRTNAKNIYGMRGTHYAIAPTKDSGVFTMFDYAESTGEIWPHPYWLSAGGWVLRPFWDHYLVTGDLDFLRNHMVPAYKDLATFYEDFLTVTDKNGNYIFVPSFSPENHPGNLNPGCMAVINASMDISVCREVLSNLVTACELLGIETENLPKWKSMVSKLPPFMLEPDGTLKEWAWHSLEERYNHRHVSHCYGAWPGDEIDPDRTPQLAKAAVLANRKRVPERLAAHSLCQRALIGARLKDSYMVDSELRQLLEQGYVGTTLLCPHDPYANMRIPDAQGGIPAIIMEMLAYSRPGVIEVLPAIPPALVRGSINGMPLRTFARLDRLAWDMETRDLELMVTSLREQKITLIARYGIQEISVSSGILEVKPQPDDAACYLHLPEGKAVKVHLKLGRRNTLDWVNWA